MARKAETAVARTVDWSNDGGRSPKTPKISELVARELANRILDGGIAEGTVLPNERELIDVFGVGRTTIREALRLLETRGLVTIKTGPSGGPVVRRPRPEDLSDALKLILQFEGASLADVLEARIFSEPMATRLAAANITDEQVAELEASIERLRDAVGDNDAFLNENLNFHIAIGDIADNVALQVFLRALDSIADGSAAGVEYPRRQQLAIVVAHEQIVDALARRDGDEAELAMREHLEAAARYLQRTYKDFVKQRIEWK